MRLRVLFAWIPVLLGHRGTLEFVRVRSNDAKARGMTMPRLIVTLGPSCRGKMRELQAAGADSFRLNASHLEACSLEQALVDTRTEAPDVPIILDLQGAKMRLGDFSAREVAPGEVVTLSQEAVRARSAALPLPHPEPFAVLELGEEVSLDDGRLIASVVHNDGSRLAIRFSVGGWLRPRKGFNRSNHPVELRDLTQRDRELARIALAGGCTSFAVSFVSDGRECGWLRQLGSELNIIAKLERADALEQLSAVAESANALWLCRGDLGAQLGLDQLGRAVSRIDPMAHAQPMWMAGQVLHHLTKHPKPTRSEICHVFDLCSRGYAGIVLSDETAVGRDPVNATRWAARLLNHASS